jgi:hypothetical protein
MIIGAIVINYINDVSTSLGGFSVISCVQLWLFFYFFKKSRGLCLSSTSYKEIVTRSYPIAVLGGIYYLVLIFCFEKYRDDATIAFYSLAVKLMTILSMIIIYG